MITTPGYLREPAVALVVELLNAAPVRDIAVIVAAAPALLEALACPVEVSVFRCIFLLPSIP